MVFPTFFSLSPNFAIRSWWSQPVRSRSCFCWSYRASPSLTPLRGTHKHLRLKPYDTNPQIFRDFTLRTQMFKYLDPFNGRASGGPEHRLPNTSDSYFETQILKWFQRVHIQTLEHRYSESSRTSHSDFLYQISQNQIWTDSLKVLRFWILNPDLPNKSDLNHVKYWLWRISVTTYTEYGT